MLLKKYNILKSVESFIEALHFTITSFILKSVLRQKIEKTKKSHLFFLLDT